MWITCLDPDLQTGLEKEDSICSAVSSHTALVKWTHRGALHQGTADPLGDGYRLMLEAE